MNMEKSNPVLKSKNWIGEHGQKLTALVFWLLLIAAYQWYAASNYLSPLQVVQQFLGFMQNGVWGVVIYIVLYAVRPLILFPATFLSVAAGFVFGPVLGVLYTIIASNISSTIAYYVGRFFGEGMFGEGTLKVSETFRVLEKYVKCMRENSFETVMIMRFIFLPYDAVSYLAGFLRIKYLPFILATALGSIPGTMAFIGFGASVETYAPEALYHRPRSVAAARFMGVSTFLSGDPLQVQNEACVSSQRVFAIRPEHIRVQKDGCDQSLPGVVSDCVFRGEYVEYLVAVNGASARARMSMPAPMFPHGAQVFVKFPREHLFEVGS